MTAMRELTPQERQAIQSLVQGMQPNQRDQLLRDIDSCRVEEATPDGSRLVFHIAGYDRPPYHGQHPYQVEGTMMDNDGAEISVLLHADENDRVLELEFIKWGEEQIVAPDWKTFQVLY